MKKLTQEQILEQAEKFQRLAEFCFYSESLDLDVVAGMMVSLVRGESAVSLFESLELDPSDDLDDDELEAFQAEMVTDEPG